MTLLQDLRRLHDGQWLRLLLHQDRDRDGCEWILCSGRTYWAGSRRFHWITIWPMSTFSAARAIALGLRLLPDGICMDGIVGSYAVPNVLCSRSVTALSTLLYLLMWSLSLIALFDVVIDYSSGPGKAVDPIQCVHVCVSGQKFWTNYVIFELDICHNSSPWPCLGHVLRSRLEKCSSFVHLRYNEMTRQHVMMWHHLSCLSSFLC